MKNDREAVSRYFAQVIRNAEQGRTGTHHTEHVKLVASFVDRYWVSAYGSLERNMGRSYRSYWIEYLRRAREHEERR